MVKFNKKNLVTCQNVSFWKIIFEYICWVLGGKPDSYIKEK